MHLASMNDNVIIWNEMFGPNHADNLLSKEKQHFKHFLSNMQYVCNIVTLQRNICLGFLFVFLVSCFLMCISKFWNKSDTKIFASTQRSCQASFHAKILKIHHLIMRKSSLNVKNCFFTSWHCSCDKAANLKLFLSLTEILRILKLEVELTCFCIIHRQNFWQNNSLCLKILDNESFKHV